MDDQMSKQDMVDCAKKAKFKVEFMAMMLLSDRKEEAAASYEEALHELQKIINEDE